MFIGKREVKESSELAEKTPAGNALMQVLFSDNSSEVIPKVLYDKLLTITETDETQARTRRVAIVVEMVFSILREYGLKTGEFGFFISLLKTSIEKHREAAEKILWNKADLEVSLLDINKVLEGHDAVLKDILSGGY